MSHFYTWDKLAKNSARLNPKTRGVNYPATPKFERILILPYVGTKSCLVKLQAYGVTQANNLHQVTLLFNDCEILTGEQDVSLWDYFKIDYKNEVYYVKKFDRLRNPLTSRCTCKDSFFSFVWYQYYKGHCLYGPPPKLYRRKTTTRPPRNPNGYIGICKHVYNAWDYLKREGLTLN